MPQHGSEANVLVFSIFQTLNHSVSLNFQANTRRFIGDNNEGPLDKRAENNLCLKSRKYGKTWTKLLIGISITLTHVSTIGVHCKLIRTTIPISKDSPQC